MWWFALLACTKPEAGVPDENAWSGEVELTETTTIAAGTTLTVAPGTTVTLGADVSLIVEGELLAQGTAEAPIVFTGDPAARWGSIVLAPGSVDATFEEVDTYVSGSILEHAIVEYATRGTLVDGASPYVHAVTFRNNELPGSIDTIGGAGLLIRDGSTARVRECRFEDNVAVPFTFGGGMYVDHSDPILQDNVFLRNSSVYGAGLSTDYMASPIVGNTFQENETVSEGGGFSLVSTVSAVLNNAALDNHAGKDGAGMHICVTCNPHAAPFLFDNVVTGNVSDDPNPSEGAAGVGAAYLGAMQHNDIYGNFREGEPSDFGWFHPLVEQWPDWAANPVVSDTWWGTTDEEAISAAVWDGTDSADFGLVSVDPVRTDPLEDPLPRAIIASRRQHYQDAGDAIPVFLTLYNPGAARTVTLEITLNGAPFTGAIEYPGATADEGAWTFTMPENSVWFATIDETSYDGSSLDEVVWEARLSDADGEIGVPVEARYFTAPAEDGS